MALCPACHQGFEKPAYAQLPYRCSHCDSHVLGAYSDLVKIGNGAMGDVYRGRRPDMGNRPVAIKIPKTADPQVHSRFEREIAASALLRHENIICAFDRGEENGRPYLVMEYVAGRSVAEIVDAEHPLSPARAARVLRQVASGLDHAARQQIVNRDIKPENILIAAADGSAKILDYGLALIAVLDGSSDRVTRSGTLLGTPGFLAPEQARDPRSVTVAADIYALGCTGYYMLCRRPPFQGNDSQEVLRAHAELPRPSAKQMRGDVGPELSELIEAMMAIDPRQRPTPRQVVERIDALLPTLSDARPAIATTRPDGRIDVACPGCRESYHLRDDMVGKQMQCRTKTCGERFLVRPPMTATVEMPPLEAELLGAEVIEAEALEAEALEADVLEADVLEALPVDDSIVLDGAMVEAAVPPPILKTLSAASDTPEASDDDDLLETIPASALVQAPPPASPPPVLESESRGLDARPPVGNAAPAISIAMPGVASKNGRRQAKSKQKEKPARGSEPIRKRPGRSQKTTWLVSAAVLLLGIAGVALLVADPFNTQLSADERWQQVQDTYQEKKWSRAEREFAAYQEEFPDDSHVAEIPFFLAMCEAGDDIFSDTGSCEAGLASAQQIFQEHRDSPAYDDYCSDLYIAMGLLVDRFTEQAKRTNDPAKLIGARQSLELLTTVAEAMQDSWVPDDVAKRRKVVQEAEEAVNQALARGELLALLQQAQTTDPLPEVDALYAKIDALLARHPHLARDSEVLEQRAGAYRAEAARVKYVPRSEDAPPATVSSSSSDSDSRTLAVVWDGRNSSAMPGDTGQVVTALSRGVLYAFNSQGDFLWHRRLGVDSHRLPGRIEATATSPAALAAVSTQDNSLLALEAQTGRVLWQYQVGSDVLAPLTIVTIPGGPNAPDKQRGLLPTAGSEKHEIHVLEMVLGKQLGRFVTGQPMAAVGGAYDSERKLIYFPADSQRVFAINVLAIDDPQQTACKSILFSGHASGALRSEPAAVGPYFVMPAASELDTMDLRAYQLSPTGFADPRAAPLKQLSLAGWSWFPPRSTPDRITLVTDEGDLGLFGLNLDNPEESIYRIVEDESTQLPVKDQYRSLAVHADEHLLWVMAGGTLRMLSLDVLHKKVNPIWPSAESPSQVTGIPLHEAQMDRWGETFFLCTMSNDGGHFDFSAVESSTGRRLWQRQLGMKLHGDPLVVGQHVVLVDHSGRTVAVDPADSHSLLEPPGQTLLPAGAASGRLMQLSSSDGGVYLAAQLEAPRQLALARLQPEQSSHLNWQHVSLSDELQGRPCLMGDHLVAPCADGHLYRDPISSGVPREANETPLRWADGDPGLDQADVYPLSETSVLLVDGARRVRRFELVVENQVTRWRQIGGQFSSAVPLIRSLLVHGDRALVTDARGRLFALDVDRLSDPPREWDLGSAVTGEPFLRDGSVLAVLEDQRLACVDLAAAGDSTGPTWTSDPFSGRIRGQPLMADGLLLVTDDSRRVSGIRLSSGEHVWQQRFGVAVGPAAAAAPLGQLEMLVPLTDGTLLVLQRPQAAATAAEAAP